MNTFELRETRYHGLWYLATPYRAYDNPNATTVEQKLEDAYKLAKNMTEFLMARQWNVFCPIKYSHEFVSTIRDMDEYYWLYTFDRKMLERCDGLIVVKMEGYRNSHGIYYERGFMDALNRPIIETEFLKEPDISTAFNVSY